MKQILILSILICLTIDLSSQSSAMPIILISSDQKAIHDDQVKTSVVPGSIMNKSGKLILAANSKAVIYHDFSFMSIEGNASPINLATIFNSTEALIPETEANLGEYISDAVYNALTSGVTMKNQKALVSGWGSKGSGGRDGWGSKGSGGRDGWGSKGSGGRDGWGSKGSGRDGWGSKGTKGRDGWGSKGSKGRDGWGSKGSKGRDGWGSKGSGGRDGWGESEIVTRATSPGGDYAEGNNLLQWEKINGVKEYQFVIEDESNNIVYTSKVKGNQFTLNNGAAKLELGKDYAWYVHHPSKREVSTPVPFRIMNSNELNSALASIRDLNLYKNADNVTKQLMEAYQLHQKGWLLASQNAYLTAIKQNSKNDLAKMMYSFFCIELGEVESAASALK
jgi:hypothetical protein